MDSDNFNPKELAHEHFQDKCILLAYITLIPHFLLGFVNEQQSIKIAIYVVHDFGVVCDQ